MEAKQKVDFSSSINIKEEKKDGKDAILLSVNIEDKKFYTRIFLDTEQKLYQHIKNDLKTGDNVKITGEIKSIKGVGKANVNWFEIKTIEKEVSNIAETPLKTAKVVPETAGERSFEDFDKEYKIWNTASKTGFFEVYSNNFSNGIVTFKISKLLNNKVEDILKFYLSFESVEALEKNLDNGDLDKEIAKIKAAKEAGKINYYEPVKTYIGGTPVSQLEKTGKARPDGRALAREMKIEVSTLVKNYCCISMAEGPGIIGSNNGIVLDRKAIEKKAIFPMTKDQMYEMFSAIKYAKEKYAKEQAVGKLLNYFERSFSKIMEAMSKKD